MHDGKAIPARPWRVIAEELSKEMNVKKVHDLSMELTRALDEQLGKLPSTQDEDGTARTTKPPLKP
jgi:hypothetical protein